MEQKKLLYEISIIRPLVILLLVVYHCLCLYTGGWKAPAGVESNTFYWWFGHLISGFRIESIAFVGGYVMAYQCLACGKDQRFFPFVWKKIKRLIIPAILFGFIFWMMFRFNGNWNWKTMTLRLLGGVEHMWFLPMLFWCFIFTWLVGRFLKPQNRPWIAWILLAILAVVSAFPNPKGLHYGLTQVNHFLFYFYGGAMLWKYYASKGANSEPREYRLSIAILLFVLYVLLLVVRYKVASPNHWPAWSHYLFKFGQSTTGIMALYLAVVELISRKGPDYRPTAWVIKSSSICYGVYVFHGFFLKWLYFYTPMPQYVNSWLLPWAAFVITMAGSVAIALLLKKLKINII